MVSHEELSREENDPNSYLLSVTTVGVSGIMVSTPNVPEISHENRINSVTSGIVGNESMSSTTAPKVAIFGQLHDERSNKLRSEGPRVEVEVSVGDGPSVLSGSSRPLSAMTLEIDMTNVVSTPGYNKNSSEILSDKFSGEQLYSIPHGSLWDQPNEVGRAFAYANSLPSCSDEKEAAIARANYMKKALVKEDASLRVVEAIAETYDDVVMSHAEKTSEVKVPVNLQRNPDDENLTNPASLYCPVVINLNVNLVGETETVSIGRGQLTVDAMCKASIVDIFLEESFLTNELFNGESPLNLAHHHNGMTKGRKLVSNDDCIYGISEEATLRVMVSMFTIPRNKIVPQPVKELEIGTHQKKDSTMKSNSKPTQDLPDIQEITKQDHANKNELERLRAKLWKTRERRIRKGQEKIIQKQWRSAEKNTSWLDALFCGPFSCGAEKQYEPVDQYESFDTLNTYDTLYSIDTLHKAYSNWDGTLDTLEDAVGTFHDAADDSQKCLNLVEEQNKLKKVGFYETNKHESFEVTHGSDQLTGGNLRSTNEHQAPDAVKMEKIKEENMPTLPEIKVNKSDIMQSVASYQRESGAHISPIQLSNHENTNNIGLLSESLILTSETPLIPDSDLYGRDEIRCAHTADLSDIRDVGSKSSLTKEYEGLDLKLTVSQSVATAFTEKRDDSDLSQLLCFDELSESNNDTTPKEERFGLGFKARKLSFTDRSFSTKEVNISPSKAFSYQRESFDTDRNNEHTSQNLKLVEFPLSDTALFDDDSTVSKSKNGEVNSCDRNKTCLKESTSDVFSISKASNNLDPTQPNYLAVKQSHLSDHSMEINSMSSRSLEIRSTSSGTRSKPSHSELCHSSVHSTSSTKHSVSTTSKNTDPDLSQYEKETLKKNQIALTMLHSVPASRQLQEIIRRNDFIANSPVKTFSSQKTVHETSLHPSFFQSYPSPGLSPVGSKTPLKSHMYSPLKISRKVKSQYDFEDEADFNTNDPFNKIERAHVSQDLKLKSPTPSFPMKPIQKPRETCISAPLIQEPNYHVPTSLIPMRPIKQNKELRPLTPNPCLPTLGRPLTPTPFSAALIRKENKISNQLSTPFSTSLIRKENKFVNQLSTKSLKCIDEAQSLQSSRKSSVHTRQHNLPGHQVNVSEASVSDNIKYRLENKEETYQIQCRDLEADPDFHRPWDEHEIVEDDFIEESDDADSSVGFLMETPPILHAVSSLTFSTMEDTSHNKVYRNQYPVKVKKGAAGLGFNFQGMKTLFAV
eukprot:CAMPEP_0194294866 /NCGR_PEP_ID=MMETSP0169-20130528/51903_1 /TAXON_ID=218684 /ORGANISM="Corethron pennatum, Strain L29A3" /LENGTH=1255 /DNA_ID=CAMNT_0039043867 /DNA_START=166 /DNA_END=3929 /DNA_ORIENTATION=-